MCVLVVSSWVLVVLDVLVSPSMVSVIAVLFSPDSVKLSLYAGRNTASVQEKNSCKWMWSRPRVGGAPPSGHDKNGRLPGKSRKLGSGC